MTIEAVNKFVGRGVISDEFRQKFMSRKMSSQEIASVDPDLDSKDLNAIKTALLFNLGDFADFSASIARYINFRYRSVRPATIYRYERSLVFAFPGNEHFCRHLCRRPRLYAASRYQTNW